MHAAVCLLRAGQPRSAGDAAKLGQFMGQFSLVAGDPTGLKGLLTIQSIHEQTLVHLVTTSYTVCAYMPSPQSFEPLN